MITRDINCQLQKTGRRLHVTCVPNNCAAVAGDTERLQGGHSKIHAVEIISARAQRLR